MVFSQDWPEIYSKIQSRGIIISPSIYASMVPEIESDQFIMNIRNAIAQYNSQIAGFQNQLNIAEVELQKLKNTEAAMVAAEAAVVVPPPTPVITPAPAVPVPTPIAVAVRAPTSAPAPVPTDVVLAPEARGAPGIAPAAEVVVTPTSEEAAVLLAGMPSWAWILIAGAAVFLLFGGEGIPGEKGKKSRRVRKRRK